ncbi:MAG: NAD(P)H-binding protein [Streptomycetaceae bacterium]|nr:NAD(P)H-binding protein [Streptomycetaceae bacterium]
MNARKKIAVVGATGRAGRHVVDLLTAQHHDVVAMSRATGVDVVTGEGLAEGLTGVDVIIDASSTPSPDEAVATEFFTASARNLHEFGAKAGVRRIVAVSIIGVDASAAGYNLAKLRHEKALLDGPLPVQILRAAQFHEFVGQLVDWGTQGDVVYVPVMRTQLIAARSVAKALVDLATGPDPEPGADPYTEIAGPREEILADAATLVVAKRGTVAAVQAVSDPDNPDRELFEGGGLLPGRTATLAGPTFEQWLNEQS